MRLSEVNRIYDTLLGKEKWVGTRFIAGGAIFRVWASKQKKVWLVIEVKGVEKRHLMLKHVNGVHEYFLKNPEKNINYGYSFSENGPIYPDPASQHQPKGVHEKSRLTKSAFSWSDKKWGGIPLQEYIIYELHVGTFTDNGDFLSAMKKIPLLKRLGVTCVEVMPVAQFPGNYNWGYDGVNWFACQTSYGGINAFKKFVNECHSHGIAVCLDVVYNHFGPEGNYWNQFGHYFNFKKHTPWGPAIDYVSQKSLMVRSFVLQNALFWVLECHVDALRLDAVHAIHDRSKNHILKQLQNVINKVSKKLNREICLIAESESNDSTLLESVGSGGYQVNAQWSDDFHHSVHRSYTKETTGYYQDYSGPQDIERAIKSTFVYTGQYSPFRKRAYGSSVKKIKANRFIICLQNHDQIGNRPWGDRLSTQLTVQQQKASALLLLMLPYTPLIFMGQEYGEKKPFKYFVDHQDKSLIEAVRKGRLREFRAFGWKKIPDPKNHKTFLSSKLNWELRKQKNGKALWNWYQKLIQLRFEYNLPKLDKNKIKTSYEKTSRVLFVELPVSPKKTLFLVISFHDKPTLIPISKYLNSKVLLSTTSTNRKTFKEGCIQLAPWGGLLIESHS